MEAAGHAVVAIDPFNAVLVIVVSIATTLISELMLFWFVYQKEDQVMLAAEIKDLNAKINKQKDNAMFNTVNNKSKQQNKKLVNNETILKYKQTELYSKKARITMILAFVTLGYMTILH